MPVFIHNGLRTPIGVVNGQYKSMRPELLGAKVLNQLFDSGKVSSVNAIFCGNAVGTGGNIARLMGLYSHLPNTIPAVTVDMQCASGMMSIEMAYAHIASGMMDTVIAGGIESSSLQPLISPLAMLEGAERTMIKHGVGVEELNPYIIRSHRCAQHAREQGILSPYILDIEIDGKRCIDESIRPSMNEKLLNRMKPLLGPNSITTAGNACLTHDGAAFITLSSQEGPFRIVKSMPWAGDPLYSPEGALLSTKKILDVTGLSPTEIDVFEWNEAFAVISALFGREYPDLVERYNMLGGALAYGHPYGCSGAMLLIHCMAALEYCNGHYGLCAIAGAGGTGAAMIIERM